MYLCDYEAQRRLARLNKWITLGKPYLVGDSSYRMLSLYINDYKGQIPVNAYLLLGDNPGGSYDSTAFGLVGRSDILGKVIEAMK
ncbi:MAG: S26 family signal peptidase [Patescibacteria group bacterium]